MFLNEVRILTKEDLIDSIQVMTNAFFKDPLWQYLYKDEHKRKKYLIKFFKAVLTISIYRGDAYGIGSPVRGIVIWDIPNKMKNKPNLRSIINLIKLTFSPFIFKIISVRDIFNAFECMKKKYTARPYYYLQSIAVSTEYQGKGYANKLIYPFITDAKENKFDVYTETMTSTNVTLYEHYGFKCMEQHNIDKKKLSIWSFFIENSTNVSDDD